MSDLSRMLDDLYARPGDDTLVTTPPEEDGFLSAVPAEDTFADALPEEDTFGSVIEEAPARAPLWASTDALDEAFASWVPGEPDGATAFERSLLAETEPAPTETAAAVDEHVEQWLVESEPERELEPVAALVSTWSPSDDDILPARRRGSRSRRSRRP